MAEAGLLAFILRWKWKDSSAGPYLFLYYLLISRYFVIYLSTDIFSPETILINVKDKTGARKNQVKPESDGYMVYVSAPSEPLVGINYMGGKKKV